MASSTVRRIHSVNEVKFQQQSEDLSKQLQLLDAKTFVHGTTRTIPSSLLASLQDRHSKGLNKLKAIQTVFDKMHQQLLLTIRTKPEMAVSIRHDIANYQQKRANLTDQLTKIGNALTQFEKQSLFEAGGGNNGEPRAQNTNASLASIGKDTLGRLQNMDKDADEINQMTKDQILELHKQGQDIQQIGQKVQNVQSELSMVDQLSRIIRNRALLTKVMLVMLVVFLGFADIMILFLKLSS